MSSTKQDCTCVCLAHSSGIAVFSLDRSKIVFAAPIGSIRLCQMLYSTSLLAYVGSGEQPHLTPRKLSLLNTTTQAVIQELSFPSSVLAIRLNRKRLVAVLERRLFVYALESLKLLSTINTSRNSQGICALTTSSDPCSIAIPADAEKGMIRIYDVADNSRVLAEFPAHKSAVVALAWNSDGSLLASASAKGTVVRVHSIPQAKEMYVLRRGASQAQIHCLAFSAQDVSPPLLACASSHGTVHLWALNSSQGTYASLLTAVMPASLTGMMEPQRSSLSLRVPDGKPMICAVQKKLTPQGSRADGGATADGGVILSVVTDKATLFMYQIRDLLSPAGLSSTLVDEHHLDLQTQA